MAAKITISGYIGYDTTLDTVQEQLSAANGAPLEVDVSSIGGFVETATAIYNAIVGYRDKYDVDVSFNILGWAESAASYICTIPGAKVSVHPNTRYMYHNPIDDAFGDYRELQKKTDWLKKMTELYRDAYAAKSGKTAEEIQAGMDAETLLTGQEIVDAGFADELISDEVPGVNMSASKEEMLNYGREERRKKMQMTATASSKKKQNETPAAPDKNNGDVKMSDENLAKEKEEALALEKKRAAACMMAMAALPAENHKEIQEAFDKGEDAAFFNGMVAHVKMVSAKSAAEAEKQKMQMAANENVPNFGTEQQNQPTGGIQNASGLTGETIEVK